MMDIRLYQINRERDEERRALLSTEALARRGFGPKVIDSSIYDCVFEGTVDCSDLEEVYTLFNVDPPENFSGHSMSVSDVVVEGRTAFFCDSIGFRQVTFDESAARPLHRKIQVVLLEPGKLARPAAIDASLERYQKIVGGMIEAFYPFEEPVCIRRQEPFPEEEQRRYRKYRTEHPPHTKAKGIAALYYYYCYELHILVRFPASAPRLSAAMRQDLRKLDRLDAQSRFLAENQIETAADLDAYRERAGHEITTLTAERTDLRNNLKRTVRTGDEAAVMEGKLQIAAISGKIMKLQENLKTCDSAQKRAEEIQAQLEALHDERKEKTDELFGRSSGTGREDEPQRR